VTSGSFQTYAAGLDRGYDIAGQAVMIRTAAGQTIVTAHAAGLAPNRTYGTHVHNLPCNVNNGGGHYQDVPGGPVDPVNEIWPTLVTNAAGVGQGYAMNAFTARPEAQAIVIHDADGARIACLDLS
jgi:Cu-Zn family superoxide dismutase